MQTPSILPSTELFNSVLWFFLLAVFLGHPKEVTLSCSSHGIIRTSTVVVNLVFPTRCTSIQPSAEPFYIVLWTSCARTWRHSSSPSFYGICKTDVTFVVHRLTAHRRWRCCPPNQTCASQLIPSILPYPTTTQGPSTTKKSASRVQESIFSSHGGRAGPCRLW